MSLSTHQSDEPKKKPKEAGETYKRKIEEIFEHIELRCGLLKFEVGQYRFRYLTFQEFLTADYIADNNSDQIQAITDYWEKDWYQEVIELYISYLSIEHKQTANDIIASIIDSPDQPPFNTF